MTPPVTEPAVIEAIQAELMLAVYDARRRARRPLAGIDAAPQPSRRALRLWRTAARRSA